MTLFALAASLLSYITNVKQHRNVLTNMQGLSNQVNVQPCINLLN